MSATADRRRELRAARRAADVRRDIAARVDRLRDALQRTGGVLVMPERVDGVAILHLVVAGEARFGVTLAEARP